MACFAGVFEKGNHEKASLSIQVESKERKGSEMLTVVVIHVELITIQILTSE